MKRSNRDASSNASFSSLRSPASTDDTADNIRSQVRLHTDHDIFNGGHVLKQANILVGPRDTQPGHPVWRKAHDRPAAQQDIAFFWAVEASDTVEESGLPGAIWANNALDGVLFYFQIDRPQRFQTAKALGYFFASNTAI